MTIHELKCIKSYFEATANGWKTFEYRLNDRDFKVGDIILLKEYDKGKCQYTCNECYLKIIYIVKSPEFNISKDYCIMSVKIVNLKIEEIN